MKWEKNQKNMHAHFVATRPTVGLWEISALNVTKSVISSMSPATLRSAEAQNILIYVCSEKRLRNMNNRELIGDLLRVGESRMT
jgi:hypothetical protein